MSRNTLTFVNHACFQVRSDSALLLVDPWLEGPVFNNGWSLVDQSTSNAAMVEELNHAGVPVYIWFSHEHPDHFSISFIRNSRKPSTASPPSCTGTRSTSAWSTSCVATGLR